MLGRATDTLLSELQSQDAALKTLERRIAEAGGPDSSNLVACLRPALVARSLDFSDPLLSQLSAGTIRPHPWVVKAPLLDP
jgi:hypothetical protein